MSELLYVFYHEKGEEGHRVEAGNAGACAKAEGFLFSLVSYADRRTLAEGVAAISIGIKKKWESLCLFAGFSAILIGMEHRDNGFLQIPMPRESLHRTICIEKA